MPKGSTNGWLARTARWLTSGALVLSASAWTLALAPTPVVRVALAEEIDCEDKDNYYLPECIDQRRWSQPEGQQQAEQGDQGQQAQPADQGGSGQQQGQSDQGQGDQGQQAAPAPAPRNDPTQMVLTLADAGKEATQYFDKQGTDKYGQWAHTRFERDRSNSASTLGPNVLDSKAWVAKDVEAAKALFKEQAAVKDFPERTEGITGINDRLKPTKFGEDFAFTTSYFQDEKVWHHYRIVIRQGANVAVLYMFGREDFFADRKDKTWNGQGDWFSQKIWERL
ncbi:MAG: hypothetical protein IT305_20030 [Chloroflexi bacterium]|nr:hypothetical protein [Chloroflexota bacterium]